MGMSEAEVTMETTKGVEMLEGTWSSGGLLADDSVTFRAAGEAAKGEFHCSECSYGVVIVDTLPACPMCGGDSWEESSWSPFARAGAL
jgi:hypothetical protein